MVHLFLRDIVFAKQTSTSSINSFQNAISETNASYICIKAYHYSITYSTFDKIEKHTALAVKNIEASFIFLARLSLSLHAA